MEDNHRHEDEEDQSLEQEFLESLQENVVTSFFYNTGKLLVFTKDFWLNLVRPPFETKEFFRQAYHFGNRSLMLVGLTSFIVGVVLTLQTQPTLKELGAESWIPSMVGISIIREIGPLITALICAGKIGSNLGAEIGSMRVTEQIDAMLISGAKPMNFIVTTRVLAVTFALPILVFYADALAIAGSYLSLQIEMDISFQLFITQTLNSIEYADFIPATIKTVFFGLAIGIVGCFNGYNASKGTTGVGEAANKSVVMSSLLIFVIDLIVVQAQKLFI